MTLTFFLLKGPLNPLMSKARSLPAKRHRFRLQPKYMLACLLLYCLLSQLTILLTYPSADCSSVIPNRRLISSAYPETPLGHLAYKCFFFSVSQQAQVIYLSRMLILFNCNLISLINLSFIITYFDRLTISKGFTFLLFFFTTHSAWLWHYLST